MKQGRFYSYEWTNSSPVVLPSFPHLDGGARGAFPRGFSKPALHLYLAWAHYGLGRNERQEKLPVPQSASIQLLPPHGAVRMVIGRGFRQPNDGREDQAKFTMETIFNVEHLSG